MKLKKIISTIKFFLIKLFTFRAFTSFEWGSEKSVVKHSYRVTGFYYVYTTSEGDNIYINVPKWKATHVGGDGVASIIVPFNEIQLTKFKIRKRWFLYKIYRNERKWLIKKDREKYKLYKSLPKGLSNKELQDMAINKIINGMGF